MLGVGNRPGLHGDDDWIAANDHWNRLCVLCEADSAQSRKAVAGGMERQGGGGRRWCLESLNAEADETGRVRAGLAAGLVGVTVAIDQAMPDKTPANPHGSMSARPWTWLAMGWRCQVGDRPAFEQQIATSRLSSAGDAASRSGENS